MLRTFAGWDGNVYHVSVNWVTFIVMCALTAATCAAQAGDLFALKPLEQTPVAPVSIAKIADGHFFIDFGRDAFGWLELDIGVTADGEIMVRLGEKASGQSVDLNPGGSIRHAEVKLKLQPGRRRYRVETPPDKRNTSGDAVRLPDSIGVVMPFRYAEILNAPVNIKASMLRQIAVHYPFDDDAASFSCSDPALNQVWELCKYSIKATSFAGIYVDGDRERIPYEADAYINQLGHYCVDREYALARHTHEYLLKHPTWPTEWKQFSVLIAHADWMYSGNVDSIRQNYDVLKNEKTLTKYARADGLLDTSKLRDIVDWPARERDGFEMSAVNTVVNAFHYRTLLLMGHIAGALGKRDDELAFAAKSLAVKGSFNEKLFDRVRGVYFDGEGKTHASLHANLFALAFHLVPDDRKPAVIAFIKSRGMACSVYPAQFLLDGLFENGEAEYAISVMTAGGERSWRNMIRAGSTITTEAWDTKFKANQDWNHAWGAAPANLIPRYVLGVRPLSPGFAKAIIAPQLGKFTRAEGAVPTVLGSVKVKAEDGKIEVDVPNGMTAEVTIPGTTQALEVTAGHHKLQQQ